MTKLTTLLGYLQSDKFELFLNQTFTGIYPDDDILTLMRLMTSRQPGTVLTFFKCCPLSMSANVFFSFFGVRSWHWHRVSTIPVFAVFKWELCNLDYLLSHATIWQILRCKFKKFQSILLETRENIQSFLPQLGFEPSVKRLLSCHHTYSPLCI